MESKEEGGDAVCFFQMPVHYPRYTKEDYKKMPETLVDRLLAEYGLSVNGDLSFKRDFAMSTFLWPAGASVHSTPVTPSRPLH
ncbi:hypothetical protein Nepgr_017211 [Nepenthes gracilis]|uniref:DUF7722 domain-containing protein n=1 Tax=Nepenthes gracilis TaxID=150966 RepID=A0AAD3SR32_NEPGR|nr:hypothetical protein Nepgr_017211 [Nepenthes gracilis]